MSTLEPRRSKTLRYAYDEPEGTDLMVRSHFLDFLANEGRLPLRSHDDAVL